MWVMRPPGASRGRAALAAAGAQCSACSRRSSHSLSGISASHLQDAAQCLQNSRGPESEQAAPRLPWPKLQPTGRVSHAAAASVPGGPPGPHCLLLIRAVITMWGLGGAESIVDPQRASAASGFTSNLHPSKPTTSSHVKGRSQQSHASDFGDWGAVYLASCPPLPCWCLGKKTPPHESRYPVIHTGHLRGLGPSRKLRWGKCDGGGFISSDRGTETSVQDVAGVKGRGSA